MRGRCGELLGYSNQRGGAGGLRVAGSRGGVRWVWSGGGRWSVVGKRGGWGVVRLQGAVPALWGQWRDGRAYIVDQDGFQVVQDIDEQIAREVVQNHNDHIAAKVSAPC